MHRNTIIQRASVATAAIMLFGSIWITTVGASAPGNAYFQHTWERTDKPVADGQVSRTWMWGPEANTSVLHEDYDEAPGGQREVQYFDKSRMEITHPADDSSTIWYVTNGLLAKELMTGQQQLGDARFEQLQPAAINVAGDSGVPGITYSLFLEVLNLPAASDGALLTQQAVRDTTLREGEVHLRVEDDPALFGQYGVTAAHHVQVPGIDHQVASPFWAFMNATGTVYENGQFVDAPLFQNPFYATGYPLAEAYWTVTTVAGVPQNVLIQCFERRCLTYTPANAPAWQVEAGNVGQHYYQWRHGDEPQPATPTPTATSTHASATATYTPTATATNTPTPTPTATATETEPSQNCSPAYPDFCIPPPPPDLNCDDPPIKGHHNFTVRAPDPHHLDTDHDGVGCEN